MSTAASTAPSIEQGQPSARTQVFICYRRNDGDWCAEWLHRHLSELAYTNYQGVASQLRLYYDKTAPGVADWKKLHFPSLQTAHAFLLVCTPGIAKDLSRRGQPDWVYEELRWWRKHRQTAPIVIDTTGEGERWLPEEVTKKWPNLNRIDLTRTDAATERSADDPIVARIRERIVETIKQSDRSTVFENLERFKKLNRRLAWALAAAFVLLLAAGVFGFLTTRYSGMATDRLRVAQSRQLAAESEIARSQPGSFVVSSLLGVEALQRAHTPEADRAARSSLKLLPARIVSLKQAARNDHVLHAMNRNGTRVLTWSEARDDDPGTSGPELAIWEVPSGRRVATLPNKKPVTAAGISPDGSRVAVAHKDSPVDIWDANTGGRLFEIPKTENATVLAFDPNGRRLAAGGWFPWVTVASLENGDITARIDADAPVLAMEFSPGAPALALGMAPTPEQARNSNYFIYQGLHEPSTLGAIKTAKVFDLARKRWAHQLDHEGAVFALRYSKDGRYLVTACWDGSARVWDTDAGVVFVRFDFPKTVPVTDVAFTPDDNSSFLAMAAANDQVVVWDWRKNVEVAKLNDAGVRKVAFSPDGLRLGTSTPKTTRVWAYMPPTELVRMHHASLWFDEPVSFGADGTWLVSGGENGQAWIWSAVNGGTNLDVKHSGRIDAVAISPDQPGALLTGGFDGYTKLWDATKGTELFKHLSPSRVHAVAFDATGKRFVSAGGLGDNHGSVRVWTREGFAILWQKEFTTRIWSVALSPDGTRVAAGDGSGIAHVWNIATGEELWRTAHGEDMAVHAVAFNADGTLVASGGLDGTVRIWNAPDGKEILRFQDPSGVLSVAFSGDGGLVAGGTINGDLRVWELRSGNLVLDLKPGGLVVDTAFSPDGRAIATASRSGSATGSGSARIWEVASGKLRMDLPVGDANAISFSPDGHLLATASSDGQARLFALRREDLIAQTCARLPRNLTTKERKEWLSDIPHDQPCPLLASTAPAPQDASARSPSGGLTGKAATFILHVEEAQSGGSPGASLVEEAVRLARRGSILESLKTVAMIEANKDLGVTLSADDWNALCWHGALHGQAKDVISACDNAVEAARKKGSRLPPDFYRDSRAVARAVIGDKEGAIADFVAYLDWCKRSRCGPQTSRRELWVRELRSGRNPLDEATLASLRNE